MDMTEDQHRKESHEHKERLLKDWKTVSERLQSSASILSDRGLKEQAGKLWEAQGWIRSSIQQRL